MKYRLSALGWYNFENLIQSLLKEIIGPGVTPFGGTKDKGRDASFAGSAAFPSKETKWSGDWVFQVKHSDIEDVAGSTRRKRVLNSFQKEIRAIKKRKLGWPDNYIYITNVPLSTSLRTTLQERVTDAGLEGNFYTMDGHEVCRFLDSRAELRRAFPQLIGLADLDYLINKHLYERSRAFVMDLQPRLNAFVTTTHYFKAIDVLREHHFLVLDGPPEHGKTFIGAALCLSRACDGYGIVVVQEPKDVFAAYGETRRQVFFADDAVGSIRFDPRAGDLWSRELPGILRVLDGQHKLIWTARHYILQEALDRTKLTEELVDFPGLHEVLVEVQELSFIERALIVYNHAKHANLSRRAKQLVKRTARFIVDHPNFTPERVRQLFQIVIPELTSREDKSQWERRIDTFLRNPSERFERFYQEALGKSERELLITLLSLGGEASKEELKREYETRVLAL